MMQENDRDRVPTTAILQLVREATRRWKLVVAVVAGCLALAALLSLLMTPVYEATVTVLPRSDGARLGLLGSLFEVPGLSAGSGAGNEMLYAKILVSDDVLSSVIDRTWSYRGSPAPVTLYEVFGIDRRPGDAGHEGRARAKLTAKLRDGVVGMVRDKATGFMIVRVRAPRDPALAADMANALVDRLDRFNIGASTSKAGRQLRFLEERLTAVREELSAAEDALVEFVESNRAFRDSPLLNQRYQRLQREAEATNAVWVELRRQVELTRLEEQRDLTTLDVLDRAAAPLDPIMPDLELNLLVATCLGFVIALGIVEGSLLRRSGAL
ncbi:MAG: hypothetical protein IPM94_08330 [bacterium]|nr:hypothetical protein [bacterium]